jgi:hypothetical protein
MTRTAAEANDLVTLDKRPEAVEKGQAADGAWPTGARRDGGRRPAPGPRGEADISVNSE